MEDDGNTVKMAIGILLMLIVAAIGMMAARGLFNMRMAAMIGSVLQSVT